MVRGRTSFGVRAAFAAGAAAMALSGASSVRAQTPVEWQEPAPATYEPQPSSSVYQAVAGATCGSPQDCDDQQACTTDLCSNGVCINVFVPGCVPCTGRYACPPVDIVFIVDTSGSLRDEAGALCAGIQQVIQDVSQLGITVNPTVLGITETPTGPFSCLTNNVVNLLGGSVPGGPQTCPFPGASSFESWGPATAIVAQRFGDPDVNGWHIGATRLVVVVSDEGPCNGTRPEGCQDPGPDRDSINNAINIATANGVIVSMIAGNDADGCAVNLGTALSNATGGVMLRSSYAKIDLADGIATIILDHCSVDDRCDDNHVCTTNDRCLQNRCVGTPLEDCIPCITEVPCDDANACTTDQCADRACRSTPDYDQALQCCRPTDGAVTAVDDGDPCTLDVCDPETGAVEHTSAAQGVPCNDAQTCTLNDRCDGLGHCQGEDVGSVDCISDADCSGLTCDLIANFCVCGEIPEVCLDVLRAEGLLTTDCLPADEDLVVNVQLGNSSNVVVGGQFLLNFDATVLEFVSVAPGVAADFDSPFAIELIRIINPVGGSVFYAVGAQLGSSGTRGPAVMAQLRFRPLLACASDTPCFLDQNPQRSLLTDGNGHQVPFTACCPGELFFHGPPPTLHCPGDLTLNADPGSVSATLHWSPPTATGGCSGAPQLSCHGTNSYGANLGGVLQSGGRIPAGVSEFQCAAVDDCGVASSCSWTIDVRPTNTVEVDVQLSPPMAPGPVRRCIVFEFYSSDCFQEPVIIERTLEFGLPFNLSGYAQDVLLEVPAGDYGCAVARDPKHTLRSVVTPQIVGDRFVARFVGDPRLGGDWLIAGNLDDNQVIDSTDETLFSSQYLTSVSPHTPCGSTDLHADFNGDGAVNSTDLSFIQRSFLRTAEPRCCGFTDSTTASDNPAPAGFGVPSVDEAASIEPVEPESVEYTSAVIRPVTRISPGSKQPPPRTQSNP